MGLRDIINIGSVVVVRGKEVPVFGINVVNLSHLVRDHGDTLNSLMQRQSSDFSVIYERSPDFVAAVIAYGTGCSQKDFKEEVEFVKQLSFSDQFTLLTAIWDETVPDPDSLKKFLGRLETMLVGPAQNQA